MQGPSRLLENAYLSRGTRYYPMTCFACSMSLISNMAISKEQERPTRKKGETYAADYRKKEM